MNNKVFAIQVADAIRIKFYKHTFKGNLLFSDNDELFKDIMHHHQSSTLEWIFIFLILVVVIDMFILKFL